MSQNVQSESNLQKQIGDLLKSGKYKLERDGWTNYEAKYFIEAGFPKEFVEPLIHTFKSDGTWKGSLWKDENKGIIALREMQEAARKIADEHKDKMPSNWTDLVPKPVMEKFMEVYIPEQKGVYYLTFLRGLEKLFGLTAQGCLGRGWQAGAIINVVHKHLGIDRDEYGQPFAKIP